MTEGMEAVRQTISRHVLCRPGECIGVAVSGGADSVLLLTALHDLAPDLGVTLKVAHVNHGLRGAESDEDQAFVEALAERAGLECLVHRAELRARVASGNLEEAARRARHNWFDKLIDEGVADKIATGHHRDDQAETVLFRLLRGTAASGLAGIRPSLDGRIIRPLLGLGRTEVHQELRRRGLSWRDDSSNQDLSFSRNRIRHETLPRLTSEWNPQLAEVLARTADVAAEEEDYWAIELDRLERDTFRRNGTAIEASLADLRELHRAVRRRLLRRAFEAVQGGRSAPEFGHIDRADELILRTSGSGKVETPGALLERSFDRIRISATGTARPASETTEQRLRAPAEVDAPDQRTRIHVRLRTRAAEVEGYTNRYGFLLDADRVPDSFVLRNRQVGDRLGSSGKLKELFQRSRVPRWERSGWPVLACDRNSADEQDVVWARGFGVAPEFRAGPDSRRWLEIREVDRAGRKIQRIDDWARGVYGK